jgi:hypothetical protein
MGTTTFSGPVVSQNGFIGAFTSTSVELQSDNGKKINLDAPNGLVADYNFVLPPNDGSNGQVLTTDGSGVTTWTTNGVGTVTSVGGTGTISGISLSGSVTASGNLTLGGALDLSSPPAIGGTAAAAGTFTALTANTSIIGAVQPLSGAGAVSVTTPITAITTTGAAEALTLADGTAGQIKIIAHAVDGGSAVLTPTTLLGYTTITFTNPGDSVTLLYTSAGWAIVGISGAVAA